jgi:hypothetical protein
MELMQGANKALLTGGTELANALPRLLEIAGAAAKAQGGNMNTIITRRRKAAHCTGGL